MDIKTHKFEPIDDSSTVIYITATSHGRTRIYPIGISATGDLWQGEEVKTLEPVETLIENWREGNVHHKYIGTI